MNSMRTLSLLETRKLARFIDCQRRVVETQRAAATDFLTAYPRNRAVPSPRSRAVLVVGSERGFCGDFNAALRAKLAQLLNSSDALTWAVIAVGRKLAAELDFLGDSLRFLDGATTAEEVPALLQRLVSVIDERLGEFEGSQLSAIYHGGGKGEVTLTTVIPAFEGLPAPARCFAYPPRIYLAPEVFFSQLVEQYLFAQLHEMVFTSLLKEHQRRVQHLDGATQRLEQALEDLARSSNALRQEEITEELQVILLGADLVNVD